MRALVFFPPLESVPWVPEFFPEIVAHRKWRASGLTGLCLDFYLSRAVEKSC